MADMIYLYLSNGHLNYEIKFSQFIRKFVVMLEGDDEQKRKLYFQMLDEDNNGYVSIPEIIRFYLDIPKTCEFAEELRYIFQFYMENYIRFSEFLKRQAKFDTYDFKTIIPDSCITRELYDRFVYRVKNNMKC